MLSDAVNLLLLSLHALTAGRVFKWNTKRNQVMFFAVHLLRSKWAQCCCVCISERFVSLSEQAATPHPKHSQWMTANSCRPICC